MFSAIAVGSNIQHTETWKHNVYREITKMASHNILLLSALPDVMVVTTSKNSKTRCTNLLLGDKR